jgi:DNA-binding MarR family transcriptional regulator
LLAKLTNVATSTPTPAELATQLRPALLRVTRALRNQRVDTSLTLTYMSALGALVRHGAMTAGALAGVERVQPPSMTKVIAVLEERGLVTREHNPHDKRQAIISITPAGYSLLDTERAAGDAWLATHLAELSAEERIALDHVIPILDRLAAV